MNLTQIIWYEEPWEILIRYEDSSYLYWVLDYPPEMNNSVKELADNSRSRARVLMGMSRKSLYYLETDLSKWNVNIKDNSSLTIIFFFLIETTFK